MLVRTRGKLARYFTQHDYAIHSGAVAYPWKAPTSVQAVLANTPHNFAWANVDDPARSKPPLCPEIGKPYEFTTLPAQTKMPRYNQGLDTSEHVHPYVVPLIGVH